MFNSQMGSNERKRIDYMPLEKDNLDRILVRMPTISTGKFM